MIVTDQPPEHDETNANMELAGGFRAVFSLTGFPFNEGIELVKTEPNDAGTREGENSSDNKDS